MTDTVSPAHLAQEIARLEDTYPGWIIWWVPRAVGSPAYTWHARRRDEPRTLPVNAGSARELEAALLAASSEGPPMS
jgi:hypothetical protein